MSVTMATGTGTTIAEDDTSPSSQDTILGAKKQAVNDFDLEDDARTPLGMHPDNIHSGESSRESNRDSRIGFRGFFGRKPDGLDNRTLMADFGGWQYPFQGQRPGPAVASSREASPAPPVLGDHTGSSTPPLSDPQTLQELPQPPLAPAVQPRAIPQAPRRLYADSDYSFRKPIPPPKSREKAASSRPGRGALATWDPPPLFQSYTQAIRHAQLPTCTTSVDTLLRVQGDRHGFDMRELSTSHSTFTEDTGSIGEKLEKPKRRHRRNTSGSSMKLGWASKIYVLLTAGHLLQYAAEGSFDRLPEKTLLLSKDSAAFASDIIPGRHWVLRVCSAMEADSNPAGDSRSLLSRLPFRGSDRSDASTFLMVFESAEDMEGWITTLRREIERLGGKKSLSETGTPKPEYPVAEEQTLPTQQTLATRAGSAHGGRHETCPANTLRIHEREPHPSDDVSTTNSVYSQDGRQLDNIRDSSHSHISSGQRTMFTSGTGSSPPCSPARDSFTSSPSEEQLASWNDSPREARLRPNATAIHERRQSLQVIAAQHRAAELHAMPHASVSPVGIPSHDPSSSYSADSHLPRQQPHAALLLRDVHSDQFDHHAQFPLTTQPPLSTSPAVPNFSVPHSSRRFSGGLKPPSPDITLSSGVEPASQLQQLRQLQQQYQPSTPSTSSPSRPPQEMKKQHYSPFPGGARNNTRKLPPPALAYSRPLSVVPDQPSPVTAPPLSCEKSADLADDSNVSSVSHSSGSERATTSSQHSGSSNSAKSRGSGTKDGFSEKTAKKRSSIQALRTLLATTISNAVMSDGMSFGVPYSAALPMPISQIPVQYRPQVLLQKAASAAAKTKEMEAANSAHEVSLKAKINEPIRETGAVATRASASLVQTAEYAEEVLRPGLPPQPWDDMDMGLPVHRPPTTYHPTSPAGGVASHMTIDAGVDRDRGRAPRRHTEYPASCPTTPRTLGRNGHSLARSVSSKAPEDRHNMPQAINGPPPAPPPTCALPPLPPKVVKLDVQRQTLHA